MRTSERTSSTTFVNRDPLDRSHYQPLICVTRMVVPDRTTSGSPRPRKSPPSRGGTKIAFYKESFRPHDVDLYTMNANGTGVKQITGNQGPEYSPDLVARRSQDSLPQIFR